MDLKDQTDYNHKYASNNPNVKKNFNPNDSIIDHTEDNTVGQAGQTRSRLDITSVDASHNVTRIPRRDSLSPMLN